MLNDLAIQPLFNSLRQYDIYDVSRDEYCASCADYTETEHALNFVAQQYTAIQNKREADAKYQSAANVNEARKALRDKTFLALCVAGVAPRLL